MIQYGKILVIFLCLQAKEYKALFENFYLAESLMTPTKIV